MPTALNGIRVLDLTSGPAGGIATMILADFGAEVLLVERPGGDPQPSVPATNMWQRGKQKISLDLADPSNFDQFHKLCAGADVLVCNWRQSALRRKGLEFDQIQRQHPQLIFCHITGFGSRGPNAELPGYEHVIAAYTGRMQLFAGIVERDGPVFSALQVGIHACAQSAATGILAALYARGEHGPGRLVETSLLQGMLAYEQGPMIGSQVREHFPDLLAAFAAPPPVPPMPSLFYHPAQAKDGHWMQFGNLLPHLFDNFLIATDLIDVVADPDFNPKQLMLPQPKHEAFRARMLQQIQQRTAADWMSQFIADGGVVATTYQTTQQALTDPDIVANGHVIKTTEGSLQIGPVARLEKTPATPGQAINNERDLATSWQATPRPLPTTKKISGSQDKLPLAGIRVIELATIIAAPLGTSFLADMGAEVIKVEQIGGDPFRGMLSGIGAARVNPGKQSLSVDLKSATGRNIVLNLIRDADVLIHNFRPGVPERLGIGYQQIAEINPGIVYLQSNGYGPNGPSAQRPSTHPIPGAAMGGVLYQLGHRVPQELQGIDGLRLWTRRLMRANEVNPDPNTAMVLTTSVMLGIMAKQHTGQGQQIFIDMFGANAYANFDDFLSYPGKPERPLPDEMLLGLSATYRLYPCAQDQWLFIALTNKREQTGFINTIGEAGFSPPALELLQQGGEAAAQFLSDLFTQHNADYWQSLLTGAGLGCIRADAKPPSEFWLQDAQVEAMGLTAETQHPSWGPYRRHGPMVIFDAKPPSLGPPPLAGQHNREILRVHGYTDDQIDQLQADRVLWQE